jgi:hypothetical protein
MNKKISATNIIFLFFPLFAAISGMHAVRVYGRKNVHGRSLFFITLGLWAWFVGEALFALYELVLKINPYPSIADVFYILAYPLVLFGIYHELKNYNTEISPLKSLTVSSISILMSIFVFYIMIFPVFNAHESLARNIISVAYGIGDMLLIVGVLHILLLIVDFKGGRLYHAWLYVLIGAIFMLLGDVLFALYSAQYGDGIPQYKLIDLLWIASYLFFSVGLFEMRFIIRDVQKKIKQLL